jgi:hypothetical protein
LAVSTALVGCGGGGDDSASNKPVNNDTQKVEKTTIAIPTQGQFIDAKVEGLFYISGSESGKTMPRGHTRLTLMPIMSPLFLVVNSMARSMAW